MIKSLTKLSIVSRNVFFSPKYITTTKLNYSVQQVNDMIINPEPKENNETALSTLKLDIDFKKIKLDNTADFNYTIEILKSMQRLCKINEIPISYLMKSENFRKIISAINKHIRFLFVKQAVALLNVLNSINVSSSTNIMQSILQIIRLQINDLDLQDIYFLTSILEYMEPTHLSVAISKAVKEVFRVKVQMLIDVNNMKELSNAFIYASKYVNDENVFKFLSLEMSNSRQIIDVNTALVIFLRLTKSKSLFNDSTNAVFNRVCSIISDQAALLNNKAIMNIFYYILPSLTKGKHHMYNDVLINKLVDISIAHNYGLYNWLRILNVLNSISHCNIKLLEHLSNYFYESPSIFKKFYPNGLSLILFGLANANYKPQIWFELQKEIFDYVQTLDRPSLHFNSITLAALDYYDSNMLQQIFSDFTKDSLINVDIKNCKLVYRLYHSVKILYPEYSGPWPLDEVLNTWKIQNNELFVSKELKFQVLPELQKLVGYPDYINTNVKIKDIEEPIDHLIFLQNGQPILVKSDTTIYGDSSSNSILDVKDFVIPEYTERVAVILLRSGFYSRNTRTLKPFHLLKIKILEKMSYKVIPIFEDIWKPMTHSQKLFHLECLFKEKNLKFIHC